MRHTKNQRKFSEEDWLLKEQCLGQKHQGASLKKKNEGISNSTSKNEYTEESIRHMKISENQTTLRSNHGDEMAIRILPCCAVQPQIPRSYKSCHRYVE